MARPKSLAHHSSSLDLAPQGLGVAHVDLGTGVKHPLFVVEIALDCIADQNRLLDANSRSGLGEFRFLLGL